MEGLEVIEQIAVTQVPSLFKVGIILGCFSVLIPTYISWLLTKNHDLTFMTEIISLFIYLVLMAVLANNGVLERPTGEYQYKVSITEDVGYIEFTDKYEVITENDDGTFIVQEKDR
jgi:hypothetical protein